MPATKRPGSVRGRSSSLPPDDGEDDDVSIIIKEEPGLSIEENMYTDTSEGPAKKKQRMMVKLSAEEEEEMVEFIRENPCLYNKKLRAWTERPKKEKLWEAQAEKLQRTVLEIQTWYDSIRTRLGRLRKLKSGPGDAELSERDEWIYESFKFLCPHIVEVHRRSMGSSKSRTMTSADDVSHASTSVADDIVAVQEEELSLGQTLPGVTTPLPIPSSLTPSNMGQSNPGVSADLMQLLERQNGVVNTPDPFLSSIPPSADRERTYFCSWMTTVLHELPRDLYRKAQSDIWNLLEHYRREHESRDQQI